MADRDTRVITPPEGVFTTGVRVPGDKSLSHRALLLAAMAEGESRITGLAPGADVATTLRAIRRFGVKATRERITGLRWMAPDDPIDCANSGTTMRLLAGAAAGSAFRTTLVGDESLMRRPMDRLAAPLGALGANIETSAGGVPPLVTHGGRLRGADVVVDLASAQVRTAFEFAAIQAEGASTIDGPEGFRDHTERWLETFGLGERVGDGKFRVDPGPIPATEYEIPADPSSAAYLWAAAAIIDGSQVATPGVSLNPGRLGFLSILERMGAEVQAEITGAIHGDPVGVVSVTGVGLTATEVSGALAAAAIDELPIVAVLAAYAEGVTVVRDAAELRVKESDRIDSTVAMIRSLGGGAEPTADGFEVLGTGFLEGGIVAAAGDHRIAMSAGVAATGANGPVTIEGVSAAAVSWPTFFDTLEAVWSSRSTDRAG
ncbi:MAG: 3-phosphoshikimate 1-carboxyvinyltransferase [Acidobacteria bacterium]|nr:3-phosphoshikimate 1-carboxyvinyltransferase [Acidobacteriota bacterium]